MKAITANRFDDGHVIYLDKNDQWTTKIAEAAHFDDAAGKQKLSEASERMTEIAKIYLIDIDENGAPGGRARIQETIRSAGPTIRRDLGYQAEQ